MSELKRRTMVIGTTLFFMLALAFFGLFVGLSFAMAVVGDSSDYFFTWIFGTAAVYGVAGIFVGRNEANKKYRRWLEKQEEGHAGSAE